MTTPTIIKPAYVTALESAYGAPSQSGFGSAVFFQERVNDLEATARFKYKTFLGKNWEHFGEQVWMRQWRQVYARAANAPHDIVAELQAVPAPEAKISVPMILDVVENAAAARQALSAAYDDEAVSQLVVFNIGDGEAMSGILIAGLRANGDATCLVFLMD